MKKRTFRILFLIFGIVLLLNIKPILQYVNHAIMQAISAKMNAEEEDRARRAAEGHIIGVETPLRYGTIPMRLCVIPPRRCTIAIHRTDSTPTMSAYWVM